LRTYSALPVERVILAGFLSLILTGTLLLWGLNHSVRPISPVDALFLSTSAVCVTGLSPLDIGAVLTLPSQLVLLLLIQLGGLGVMTATTALSLLIGQRIGLRERIFFSGGFGLDTPQGAVRLLVRVLVFTAAIEAAGALLLFVGFLPGRSPGQAAYLAIFHSVSAFCNAGFSPLSTNLEPFASSLLIPGTIMGLIVLGGLGFPVLSELYSCRGGKSDHPLSPYSRLVLFSTVELILGGTVILAVAEWGGAFAPFSPAMKVWNALFASVTPRTAGFDMVPCSAFSGAGIAVTILLMIVGASPASTGGGIKTTTFGVLVRTAWSELRREGDVELFGRRVEFDAIRRALALTFAYVVTIFVAALFLSFREVLPFRDLLFEAASAMGTVGLSLGITAKLSPGAKLVLVCLMFWGRVGIVTFFYGLFSSGPEAKVTLPPARIPIG
jgi:trk system potassium uptake protein TrkH